MPCAPDTAYGGTARCWAPAGPGRTGRLAQHRQPAAQRRGGVVRRLAGSQPAVDGQPRRVGTPLRTGRAANVRFGANRHDHVGAAADLETERTKAALRRRSSSAWSWIWIVSDRTLARPAKSRCHRPWLIITAGGAPGRSSSGCSVRPSDGCHAQHVEAAAVDIKSGHEPRLAAAGEVDPVTGHRQHRFGERLLLADVGPHRRRDGQVDRTEARYRPRQSGPATAGRGPAAISAAGRRRARTAPGWRQCRGRARRAPRP